MAFPKQYVRKVYSPSLVVLYIFTKWVVYQYYKRLVTISSSKTSNDALVPLIQWALQTRALFEVIHLVGRLKAFRTDAILAPLVVACIRAQAPMEAMCSVSDHEVSRLVHSFPRVVLEGKPIPLSLCASSLFFSSTSFWYSP